MMDSFDEWVKNQDDPALLRWADRLIELGASWQSFRRDASEIVEDLVAGGIPLLSARDIVRVAADVLKQNQAPMAIFWDLENLPIPAEISGRDVAFRLKNILAPLGNLIQFRGYASIGEGLIPQKKRSDLQLSGCHLVDCPHIGRKDVVDKMIIVDVMKFAFTHPDAATICLITGDVDYAYLLANLQQPQWRTIVISKGTIRSMLHVNCNMKMRWETDILQMKIGSADGSILPEPLEMTTIPRALERVEDSQEVEEPKDSIESDSTVGSQNSQAVEEKSVGISFEPLTRDEQWDDDVELLRTIIRHANVGGNGPVRKAVVGNKLRETNPARFNSRDIVKSFLARVIDKHIVSESGEGAFKELTIMDDTTTLMAVSDQLPIPERQLHPKVFEVASVRPYLIFVRAKSLPNPSWASAKKAFVQKSNEFFVFLFRNLTDALRAASASDLIRAGRLVDWRRVDHSSPVASRSLQYCKDEVQCNICKQYYPSSTVSLDTGRRGGYYCSTCAISMTEDWMERGKAIAISRTIAMMELLASCDDVYVMPGILKTYLTARWPADCASTTHATLWIHETIEAGSIRIFYREDVKAKSLLCLKRLYSEATAAFPSRSIDTTNEEAYVETMIWDNNGYVDRRRVVAGLRKNFATMGTSFLRFRVFTNAVRKGRFFIGKGPYGQTVVLSKEDIPLSLRRLRKDAKIEVDNDVDESSAVVYEDMR